MISKIMLNGLQSKDVYHGHNSFYTQTWSGNLAMVRVAEKLGFKEVCRKKKFREVDGKIATLNLRVNSAVKENAENVLAQLGIPMATAIDMYLKQISLVGGIPLL